MEEKDILLKVSATNYPLLYFTQRIGGEKLDLHYPISEAEDATHYFPDEKQILELQDADLIVRNGAGFEPWIDELNMPGAKMVNTSAAFTNQYLRVRPARPNNGTDLKDSDPDTASFTWLNFRFAGQQAYEIKKKLVEIDPENKDYFEENYGKLALELSQLNRKAIEILDPYMGMRFYCSSPVYQYFGQAYLIDIQNIPLEKEKREESWGIVLSPDQPSEESRTSLESMGLDIVVFDPCISPPSSGDFLSKMIEGMQNLEKTLQKEQL